MRAAIGRDAACDGALRAIFGPDLEAGVERLAGFLDELDVPTEASAFGVDNAEWQEIAAGAFAGERGRNYIGDQDRFMALAS